ncbi:MAG: branched-chain amino acid aminotransferase [Gammaproteobacteria bacterium]|nr:branched-chain amino acid aminotransferase [Gammaproteobacteria bacterium]
MAGFGSVFMPEMTLSRYDGEQWSSSEFVTSDQLAFHPGAHGLHYASSVFEGLKAFAHDDGSIKVFRMDRNLARLANSSELLALPPIDIALTEQMITDVVKKFAAQTPEPPGSMYIRPTHIGTDAAIGAAASPSKTSVLYILLSPVGDYFSGGDNTLSLLIEEKGMRCAPHMGMIKSGGNYASALGPILQAKATYNVDQILFCPNGDVQETGAANFLLIDGNEIITKNLDSSFLHGITRDSLLTLAKEMGMVVSERALSVDELLERVADPACEAALSGTAAVLTPVGKLIRDGEELSVGNGKAGPTTVKLRQALNDIQWGRAEDSHGWLTTI